MQIRISTWLLAMVVAAALCGGWEARAENLGSPRTILVTGGAGYIGSHTVLELLRLPESEVADVVVVDNLANACAASLDRVAELAGRAPTFAEVDIRDRAAMDDLFASHPDINAVIHFAGHKAVGESVARPLSYYDNNVGGTITLLEAMAAAGVRDIVFSSSATVYGDPVELPIPETHQTGATNPYGQTKLHIEHMLEDVVAAGEGWNAISLRYFNPLSNDPSGRIGEDPRGTPNNLAPFVMQVAVGRRPHVTVFGSDYPTPDGTGVRDYIHVVDLARGHLAALDRLASEPSVGFRAYNLGTGRGYSVLEIIAAVEAASGRSVPVVMTDRRPGDVASVYANVSRAKDELGWEATKDLVEMMADHWRWQSSNPYGYQCGDSDQGRDVGDQTEETPSNSHSHHEL